MFKEKDWKNWKKGKKITMGLSKKRYKGFLVAMKKVKDIAKIKHSLYLIWYYDKKDKASGFYINTYGIVAINGFFLRKYMNKMTKINQSFHVLDLISHELSHDLVPAHNSLFIQRKDFQRR